ncbi:MAG TPA: PorV/PorQ family protein [Saprospiraceae bacterium]|nr:PorV/PorQ family protein [Saprospiraceae bacterium]
MKQSFSLFILFLLGLPFLSGQAKYSNEFLTLGVGARAHGMGGAVGASVSDLSAAYWNPAGMTSISSPAQFHGMHAEWFAGIAQYDQLSFGKRFSETQNSYGAISLIRMGIDNIPNTLRLIGPDGSINYDRVTTFSAADYAAFISYAKRLGQKNWFAGGSVKIIHRSIGSFGKAWGFGADIGIQHRGKKFSFALMGRDLTTTFNSWSFTLSDEEKQVFTQTGNDIPVSTLEQTLPTFVLAGAYHISMGQKSGILIGLDLDVTTDGERNTLISTNTLSINPRMGFEVDLSKRIFLRGGISNLQEEKDIVDPTKTEWIFQPNAGIGLKLGRLHLDYAFTNIGDVSGSQLYSHIFGLILDFEDLSKKSVEE